MRGHKPPGHPPALYPGASTRRLPAGDGSGQTHQGKRRGGPGGLRVGRPSCPNLAYTLEKMQDARDSRRNKNTPPPTREPRGKHRENTARGTHQPRGKKNHKGRGKRKRGKGNPTKPEETRSATRRKKRKTKTRRNRWGKHLEAHEDPDEVHAQHQARASVVETKRNKRNNKNTTHSSCRQSVLLTPVILKGTSHGGRCNHPPFPFRPQEEPKHPKQTRAKSLKG